jgi:hypothetical protein
MRARRMIDARCGGQTPLMRFQVVKRSRYEREQRAAQNIRIQAISEAMYRAIPPAEAAAFEKAVEAARARGPVAPPPNMAPGTAPRPPRPGHEPRPPKEDKPRSRY